MGNPTYIPESSLFTAIREAARAGATVEFEDPGIIKLGDKSKIEVTIKSYRESVQGKVMLHQIVDHELGAEKAIRHFLSQVPDAPR